MDYNMIFLQDCLDQVIANPTASYGWHKLGIAYSNMTDEPLRKSVIQQLLSESPGEGPAGFLRATFLFSFTEDSRYMADAARIAQETTPFNVDRLVTFLAYAYGVALRNCNNRVSFLDDLRNAAVPEILSRLGSHLEKHISLRPVARKIPDVKKAAIIAPLLSIIEHGPTSLALHHSQLLADHGISAEIFTAQEWKVPERQHFLGRGEEVCAQSPPDLNNWAQFAFNNLRYHVCRDHFSLMTRYRDILKLIMDFDPDIILFVGFFSPLLSPLFACRPIIGLSAHTLPPIGPIDIWLSADLHLPKAEPNEYPWSPHFTAPMALQYPYRVKLKPADRSMTRRELGLETNSVVLVSVGDFLDSEIVQEWAALMKTFLKSNENVRWLLVGGLGQLPASLKDFASSQIRTLAHHNNLQGIYKCCDIFVNPPRMGGGLSVAMAMAEGLPALAYAGSDGGDKVAMAAVPDDKVYFTKLANLVNDPAMRREEGEAMKELFLHTLDLGHAAPSFMDACALSVESYNKRIMKKAS